jgi:hypothetical protein
MAILQSHLPDDIRINVDECCRTNIHNFSSPENFEVVPHYLAKIPKDKQKQNQKSKI